MTMEKKFFDAWAELYISKKSNGDNRIITYTGFPESMVPFFPDEQTIALWEGTYKPNPSNLPEENTK